MRTRTALFLGLLIFATPLFAIDRWLLITGAVGVFHTDARIFNPAFDKDIQVTANFFSTGGGSPQSATVSVPKRQMLVLDDVTARLFGVTNGLGAIQFTSNDSFEASSRIYAQAANGTLGQFAVALPASAAKTKGALLQLKSSGAFRTNLGLVNPNNVTANVTFTLYDKNSAIVSSKTVPFTASAVLAPTNMASGFFFDPKTADLSDAWVSFSSDQPVLMYASVVDNGTTDPTFIPAVDDAGIPPSTPPATKDFTVTMQDFQITVSPDPGTLKVGDKATFHISLVNGSHTFEMVSPSGSVIIPNTTRGDRTITISTEGTYTYFCNNALCGAGHGNMIGDFIVGAASPGTGRGY